MWGRSMREVVAPVALFLTAGVVPAVTLSAQTDPRLVAAVHAAQEGHGDSARSAVQRLLATVSPNDTLYPQVLYTAGMVASEAADMRRQLQRVVVEFPTSSWADDALLRLAQLDYATHQLDEAVKDLERIALDFPVSPLIPQAAYWAGRVYFDLKNDTLACRWLADGMARSRDDVEIQTQLGYLYQRCDPAPAPASDSAGNVAHRPDSAAAPAPPTPPASAPVPPPTDTSTPNRAAPKTPAPKPAPAPPLDRSRFRVQVAAVGTAAAADALVKKAKALGYTTVVVQERGLYKVRAGGFATREAAQQAAGTLKAKLGGSPFVVAD